jgi:protein-disulfide isomerase
MRDFFSPVNFYDGRARGCAIFGWTVFALLLVLLLILGYRTFYYYREFKAGNIIEMPRNAARLTLNSEQSSGSITRIAGEEIDIGDQPALGATREAAKVTVVMFGDFECPFSREAAIMFRRLAVIYGEKGRFVYRDFPLQSIHANAYQAAVAAECAREQRRYWEYFDRLYSNIADISPAGLARHAEEVSLDKAQFEACLNFGRYDFRVTEDLTAAQTLGLRGTPTFYINGRQIEGAITEEDFERAIKKFLQ